MHFTQVTTGGLRGRYHTVDLSSFTLLTGPNGAGKSTIIDALVLATCQRLPGQPVDRDGMVTCSTLDECCDDTGIFKVEACDSEGGRVAFSYTRNGKRQVAASFCAGTQQEIRAAIAARYGDLVATLDLGRVMQSGQLEAWVAEELAKAPVDADALWGQVLGLALADMKRETRERLSTETIGQAFAFRGLGTTAQEVLAGAAKLCSDGLTVARSMVREAGSIIRTPAPQQPTGAQLEEARQHAAAARAAFEAALAARVAAEAPEDVQARGEVARLEAEVRAAERAAERATRAEEVCARALRDADAAASRPVSFEREDAAVKAAEARLEEATAALDDAVKRRDALHLHSLGELQLQLEQLQMRREAVKRERDSAWQDVLQAQRDRPSWDGHGPCPTCGNPYGGHVAHAAAAADARLKEATAAHEDAESRLVAVMGLETGVRQAIRDKSEADAEVSRISEGQLRATEALDTARRALKAAHDRVVQQRDAAERAVHDAEQKLQAAVDETAEIRRRLEALRAELAQAQAGVAQVSGAQRLADAQRAERSARVAESTALDVLGRLEGQVRAAEEHAQRVGEAEQRRVEGQAWTDAWSCLAKATEETQASTLAAMWAPFVEPVSQLAADFELSLGEFQVRTGGTPQAGWRTAGGWVPLSQLSHGQRLQTGLLVVASLHLLRSSSGVRVLAVDAVEGLDEQASVRFSDCVTWLLEEGHLDQVVVASVADAVLPNYPVMHTAHIEPPATVASDEVAA